MLAKLAALSLVVLGATTATVQPAPAASPSPVLVTFEQTGGFAAIERGLTVRRSGALVSDGLPLKAKQLSAARMARLRTLLTDAHFATLKHRYEPAEPIADGFVYRISYGGRRVEIGEDAKLPERLAGLFASSAEIMPIVLKLHTIFFLNLLLYNDFANLCLKS